MKYLVDANVLSEPTKASPDPHVVNWLRGESGEWVVDPVVVGELRFGILLLPKGSKRRKLEAWFSEGMDHLICLTWDKENALIWAELLARLRRTGKSMPVKDSLIAASALRHKLKIVTRNTTDFKHAGVSVINPFKV